jgi:hypothetical protein
LKQLFSKEKPIHRGTQEGGGGGGTSCTPSKDFKKMDRKNAIKHENSGPLPDFSHNPKVISKEYKNECASMNEPIQLLKMAIHLIF